MDVQTFPDFRELNVHDIAEMALGVIRDADRRYIAFKNHPFMVF
jgi:hypothetical protein